MNTCEDFNLNVYLAKNEFEDLAKANITLYIRSTALQKLGGKINELTNLLDFNIALVWLY